MIARSNILFITADQWRGDCLSARKHPCVQTPNLDALAADGVLFAKHYAQAVPCGPSRASLHTGQYLMNHRSGRNGTPLDRRHVNWAQVVRAAGYDPVLFGYTDTTPDPRDYPADHPALTDYEGVLPGITVKVLLTENISAWADWLAERGYDIPARQQALYRTKVDQPEWEEGGPAPAPLKLLAEHHDTFFMVDQVIDYVREQRGSGAPWCAHLSLLRPHPPWIAPAPYNTRYHPDLLPPFTRANSAEMEAGQHPWLAWQLAQRESQAPAHEARLRRLQASYFGLMSEVDDNIGRLITALKETGAYDDTLIIFTSDHGEQMGDHWLLGKTGYFDQSYHIPLIVRDPRSAANGTRGSVVTKFTENIDIMPTMLDWLGIDIPHACDGESLRPFLTSLDGPTRWRGEAHWEYDFRDPVAGDVERDLNLPMHACALNVLRDDDYKYVHFAGLAPLLFNLRNDPGELNNLAHDPAHATVMLTYAQRMLSWRMRHDEQTLTHHVATPTGMSTRRGVRW